MKRGWEEAMSMDCASPPRCGVLSDHNSKEKPDRMSMLDKCSPTSHISTIEAKWADALSKQCQYSTEMSTLSLSSVLKIVARASELAERRGKKVSKTSAAAEARRCSYCQVLAAYVLHQQELGKFLEKSQLDAVLKTMSDIKTVYEKPLPHSITYQLLRMSSGAK